MICILIAHIIIYVAPGKTKFNESCSFCLIKALHSKDHRNSVCSVNVSSFTWHLNNLFYITTSNKIQHALCDKKNIRDFDYVYT